MVNRHCRILLQLALLLIHYVHHMSASSPSMNKQPAAVAPIPMVPFTYDRVPQLSGLCGFNFSSAESILKITAVDCWSLLAPYLANTICCPQFEATLLILMGQYYYYNNTNINNIDQTDQINHCISDVEKILESNGAAENLHMICSINSSITILDQNHRSSSSYCPVSDLDEVNRVLETSSILDSCGKIVDDDDDQEVSECCNQVCQNAISTAARKLASRNDSVRTRTELVAETNNVNDCKKIVLIWLASRLEPSTANRVLRVISSCRNNKACPLVFPDIKNVSKECRNSSATNQRSCCVTMENYMSQLHEQSFLTNIQALNCATNLGVKLQNQNVTINVYNLCHTKLKDFSLQVQDSMDSKGSTGCLFPNLPSDITFDNNSGIGFICDLNNSVEAPWPSADSLVPQNYSCNKTKNTLLQPELPKSTSSQRGIIIHIGILTFAILMLFL